MSTDLLRRVTPNLRLKDKRYVVGLGLIALLALLFLARKREADAIREETLENAIPTVSITNAKPGASNETITLPGNVEAWFQAPIYAQVSGYVKMWYKDYGAQVKKGDVLAEINTPTLDAQFSQAKAALEAERAKYNLAVVTAERWTALRKSHAVSEQEISVQEANMKSEKAQLEAAEHNVNNFAAQLQFKTIVAPYDGFVTARNINVGDYINKDGNISDKDAVTNLFSVADIHQLRLFISVPEAFAHILKAGLTADVTVPQFPNRRFKAKFLTVANGFDPTTRTAITEFTIDNEDKALWPGSYAAVKLTVPLDANALTVPSSALVFQENGAEVAIVGAEDKIHFKPVRINRILDGVMELTSGVGRDDRIVNNPSAALLEGDKVRIVTSAPGYEIDPKDLN
ncbi:efflux RND transporter periplasmic adaptor subunit [Methylocystis parvus]|uniref:Efflux RND transporter periplasmic adaptor subunit n=1 Tax=Methylocystis parvus TaxID=134 RepID=A0A6B8M5R1_9HYPH|nr:efflux RND transporter periplasmic adaptor subunit [Methylocystis parvus]QGM97756.1 efflux RND transporter periplasmic adaptor subunit [Methylocystis parvus]WBK01939.1 efflux RND transporter periplasmic adaptor subunit [Methylocystis parvus OBBP]